MTKPVGFAAPMEIASDVEREAVIALLAIGEEFGDIALTIAAAIETADATPSVRAAADQLRRAAATLRQRVVQFRDDMRTA